MMADYQPNVDEAVVDRFESSWLTGQPLKIQHCIAEVSKEQRTDTLVELVIVDLEFGWKKSVRPSGYRLVESYLQEFPELRLPEYLKILAEEEYRVRHRYGDQPDFPEFEMRFGAEVKDLEFTQWSEFDAVAPATSQSIRVGSQVGPFQVTGEIGSGGMGSVYVAEQSTPVRRKVALKVIRAGLNTKEVIARFEAERQALALMQHKNIAAIVDAGTTPDGLPYFAMELVEGVPITEFCDSNQLNLRQRLNLFVDVCQAVQHAHQKGIIHRDLKPSNILVADFDDQPVAKVIDFGLAKALQGSCHRLTDKTLQTEFGQVVGTLKYMSPEQANTSSIDIDTRTDIYALGIILYELLTGSTPLDQNTIEKMAMLKLLEFVRDHDPPRPSIRLDSDVKSAITISEQRSTNPNRLSRILRGDLDWVVMKALERERNRRYETAEGLADDVRRFLDDQPVIARPPSVSYQLAKFVRKHRGFVASLCTLVVVLSLATAVTTVFAIRAWNSATAAIDQRRVADKNTTDAIQEREAALKAEENAQSAANRTYDVLNIVADSFQSINPLDGGHAGMLAKDVLIQTRNSMEGSELDLLGQIKLLETLTSAFEGLKEFESAITSAGDWLTLSRSEFGPQHPETNRAQKRFDEILQRNRKTDGIEAEQK